MGSGRRRWWVVGAAVVVLAAASGVAVAAGATGDNGSAVRMQAELVEVPGGPTSPGQVQLDTTLYLPTSASRDHPAPAVVVSPGFGQSKSAVDADAQDLASHGYVALAWSLRGFGRSSGRIALDAPDTEVADLRVLLDRLSRRSEVLQDGPGDPRVALVGASYGGGVSLLGAAYDRRVDATVPVITWNSLDSAFLPGGVFKATYASVFFASGPGGVCARFAQRVCLAYNRLATTGRGTAADRALLAASSPASVMDRITAPTLLVQGQDDTLFPLQESLRTAAALEARHVPVHLAWLQGGHDKPFDSAGEDAIRSRTRAWLDRYLRRDTSVDTGPVFTWHRTTGGNGSADRLPTARGDVLALQGPVTQPLVNPPGGRPASVSSVPGAGALGGAASALGLDVPGQTAAWTSARLPRSRELLGEGHVSVTVRSSTGEAVLFAKVQDIAPDGTAMLPGGQVAPVRLSALPAAGRAVTVALPALAHVFPAGHRLRVSFASTDLVYAGPLAPASYAVTLVGGPVLPLAPVTGGGGYLPLGLVALLLALAVGLVAALVLARRRARRGKDLGDDTVPLVVISGLAKSYADGFRAVDGVDLVLERGQVLGLLGPNGSGKTTTLRMLAGLIAPTEGEVRLFGRPVRSGAAVLSRVGLFIEGPGLLPHLTGMENLQLYWTSTARSMAGSYVEEALDIAGLGDAVDRPVRTYSQGMRQRLAIAQAMLGRPDLLVLDEPTNGLDPPQIKQVREVVQRIAATGRTVLVSSHQLAEVEQTCSHVAVMSRGKVVASGTLAEVLSGDGLVRLEVASIEEALPVVRAVPGVRSVEVVDGGLVVDLDGAPRSALVAALVQHGVAVEGLSSRRRLEDVFLELLGQGAS